MRVGAAMTPPVHGPVDAASGPSNLRDHTTWPVSLSIMWTLFELSATIDVGTNSVTPLAVTPCVRS
jgi:hypothetical protein